jgi:hypothetical protein
LSRGKKSCDNDRVAAKPFATAPEGGGSTLHLVIGLAAVIAIIGVLGVAMFTFVASRIINNSPLPHQDNSVKVETPIGILSANDPEQAVRDLGVDIYPGATVQKKGAADLTIGPARTIVVNFESNDSAEKICGFYKSRILGSTVKSTDQNHCTVVSKEPLHVIIIKIEGGETTKFQIACVTKPAASSN